ncbi:alpha/beta hydrolase [Mycobacterium paraffinicum]|uniref:Alpha/beta hydrolase n=1 Tax=Mycobacterium paraffinicum TaxID=53378 RepID=A0A1Q4I2H0_9MYCO|nr:alpha/beta hydrolase [Mycobacterium paraffinicum]OJZ76174.1 alpha/beta hydrolase [Mycobacterium paraffinicum]
MTDAAAPLTFGDIDNRDAPLAILVHGFPDTPYTFRYLAPQLAEAGFRVVAPWLPGYTSVVDRPISTGTYVKHIHAVREEFGGDTRALLVGHDWGAMAAYGAVASAPRAFRRLVTLAVPPTTALTDVFVYRQIKRSFYIWFIQQPAIPEIALLKDGFWEGLWADWSPGYDASSDIAMLRGYVTAETIGGVIAPYRAQFNPAFADPDALDEAIATLTEPPVPTLYLHGAQDGALGAEVLTDVEAHLPAPGSDCQIIDGAGHFLHLEQPDVIWAKIRDWLLDGREAPTAVTSGEATLR